MKKLLSIALLALLFTGCNGNLDEELDGMQPEISSNDEEPAADAFPNTLELYFEHGVNPRGMMICKADYTVVGTEAHLEFFAVDFLSSAYPTPVYRMSISYTLPEGQTEIGNAKIAGGDYEFVLSSVVTPDWVEPVSYKTNLNNTKNTPLVIKRVGDKVSVYINKANIGLVEGEESMSYRTLSFYFNNTLPFESENGPTL